MVGGLRSSNSRDGLRRKQECHFDFQKLISFKSWLSLSFLVVVLGVILLSVFVIMKLTDVE